MTETSGAPVHSHHTAKKIIIAVILVPISLFIVWIALSFVLSVFERSERISQGNYTLESRSESPSQSAVDQTYTGAQKELIEGKNNQALGAENPTLTIVEFSDFACPYCLASFPALREVSLKYKDSVRIIFRDWPGHEYSVSLALGAYCAGEQDKFWEMHDKLFQYQSDTLGSNNEQLILLASQIGVETSAFKTCLDNQTYLPKIRENFLDSQTLGVRGTPTWFFNGEKVEGALTAPQLEAEILKRL